MSAEHIWTESPKKNQLSMATGKVVLSTASGATQEFDSDQPNLTSDFVSANVQSGVWIFYEWGNYADAQVGYGQFTILDETQGLMSIPFVCGLRTYTLQAH